MDTPPAPSTHLSRRATPGSGPLLTFRISASWMAVPVQYVAEICDFATPTPVPMVPPHIPGVFTLRGQVVPLLDLQAFLGFSNLPRPADAREVEQAFSRIVLVAAEGMRVGLVCHQVRGVQTPRGDQLRRPEVVQGELLQELILAEVQQDRGVLFVLDLPRLLQAARVKR